MERPLSVALLCTLRPFEQLFDVEGQEPGKDQRVSFL
jgi:hypothetical protein